MKKTYQGKKLFLCSSFADVAGLLNIFEKNLKGKIVTFIPTASKVEKINFYVKDAKKELEKAGMIVDILDISQAEKSEIVKKIKNNDFIYVSGGNIFYLLQEMKKTGADEIIVEEVNNGKLYMCIKNTVRVSNTESEFEEFTLNSTYKSDVVDRGSKYFLTGASEYSEIITTGTRVEVKNLSDMSGVVNLSIKAKDKGNNDVLSYRLYLEDRESKAYTFAQPTLKKRIGEKIYVIFDTDVKKDSCRVDYYLYK